MDPEGWCAVEAGESVRPATTTLSWSNRKMTAARSRGRVASTCVAVSVPARKAATNAGSRIGATAVMVRINTEDHQLRPETVQKTEGLRQRNIPIVPLQRTPDVKSCRCHPLSEIGR